MSSDMSADQLALARQHIETALGGIAMTADAVAQAWAAIQGAGEKYTSKYSRMAGAEDRMRQVIGQMQGDIADLQADEANERGGTA